MVRQFYQRSVGSGDTAHGHTLPQRPAPGAAGQVQRHVEQRSYSALCGLRATYVSAIW